MDKPLDESAASSAEQGGTGDPTATGPTPPTPEERRAERVARRKAAEAEMSWDEVRASRRARAADRQDRLAALPEDQRAAKEAELAKAKQDRLAGRTQP